MNKPEQATKWNTETTIGDVTVIAHPTEGGFYDRGQPVNLYGPNAELSDAVEYAATWYDRETARDMYRLIEVVWNGHVIATYEYK